ncbi:hypothetical protein CJA_2306 [Cellvibrio japonicus Ueda107]|uniref:Uncharacterized protein n=1 Tax=Cellvibrio japonicus (strain Ueda107) TaxID=498211 RepID=B3PJU6_CELJU|nr:hypothetical protein CJA_2306 [Cellvibrio japonicus Ueda107]
MLKNDIVDMVEPALKNAPQTNPAFNFRETDCER